MHGRVARLGRRDSSGCASEGETTLFVAATPGRAERTIELLKEYERLRRAGRARRRRALRGGARGRRAACRADSACPTPAFRSTPKPMSSRKSAARPSAAGRRRKAFLSDLRDLKIGDLVVHVDHGIGVFVGLQADWRRRQRCRNSSSFATPATTSCSSPSSGWISFRSTPARRAAGRSAGRHVVGAREDPGQEGHARHGRGAAEALRRAQGRARPRLQPPIRTGSRSSRTRSSTS